METINADIADARARQAKSEAEIAAHKQAKQDLDAIDVHAPDAIDALNAFADAHQLKKRTPAPRAAIYKALLLGALAAKQRPRDRSDPLSPVYILNEIATLEAWQTRLHDPKFVFGEGKVVPAPVAATATTAGSGAAPAASNSSGSGATSGSTATPAAHVTGVSAPASSSPTTGSNAAPTQGPAAAAAPAKHWDTKMQVSNAALMQFIEHGFIRHDDMPARSGGKDPKQVFNAEVATTLARFGFSPGAAFRDTMHFDFIEDYSAAPGGRSQPNMNKTKYGPSGDIPSPAPDPQAQPAAKKDTK